MWPPKSALSLRFSSKSSPPPSTYDEPGKPFDALLKATGCPADPNAMACLGAVPSEVHFLRIFWSNVRSESPADTDEHKQCAHHLDP